MSKHSTSPETQVSQPIEMHTVQVPELGLQLANEVRGIGNVLRGDHWAHKIESLNPGLPLAGLRKGIYKRRLDKAAEQGQALDLVIKNTEEDGTLNISSDELPQVRTANELIAKAAKRRDRAVRGIARSFSGRVLPMGNPRNSHKEAVIDIKGISKAA